MTLPKVLVIILTASRILPLCMESVIKQDYKNYSLFTHAQAAINPKEDYAKTRNSTLHRNAVRAMALASDADYFLLVDSDTVIPSNTISKLIESQKDIVGGWYSVIGEPNRWVAGKWNGDSFHNFSEIQQGLVPVDMAGLGCLLISRKVLQEITFDAGLDKTTTLRDGTKCPIGICAQFGIDAKAKGYELYMNSAIVCQHLQRPLGYT